ncbi:MAG: thioredoxin [Candidatus Solincola sediminis]|uniref:Thioredoxin n=1 Tax=Candidatus Solincola sediminis TaxID=1797199 RepID=A0A1F2WR51_9ACTN|nr:MAG: thioredoxin [Candidatus Solincola sediminis]OFW61119.1 MAG: thioredoxin [Candidatus Solincola sediminis]
MAGNIVELNDANFEQEVLKSDLPTLVDFWAPWCGPCQMMGPILEEASSEWDGKIKVGKVNVDEVVNVARNYEIQSIPTMVLFDKGEPVKRIVGARPKKAFEEEFRNWL